jgi:putative copper export protein
VLAPDLDTVRLGLHLLAATVWVGGQLVLVALLPVLRRAGDDVPAAAARRFSRVAWPAFGVLVATGVWNLAEVDFLDAGSEYQATVFVKLLLVAVAAIAAVVHAAGRSRRALAIGGALGLLGSLGAFFLGVVLRTGS